MMRVGVIVDRVLAVAAALLLGYWALYVLVAPVVNGDAQGYNLGRLLVAERHGLFDNPYWTNPNQIVFPWTFDAVHYPFVKLGVLENLPSFLCFVGLVCVAVLLLRRAGAGNLWPVAVLALLASPMVILQATTTKNDFPLLFFAAAGCWFFLRWVDGAGDPQGRSRLWLPVLAALCGAFAMGTKTTGALLVIGLSAWALAAARRCGRRGSVVFFAALVVFLVLFGSVEILINNGRMFGDWQGETQFVHWHQHHDGIRGALANAVRYFFNGLAGGLDPDFMTSPASEWLRDRCKEVLHVTGLEHYGLRGSDTPDSFYILITNVDSQTTFGLVGILASLASLALLARVRFRAVWWWLALAGWAYFGAFCMKVGWGNTNLRMLTPSYGLWIVAVLLAIAPWLHAHAGWRRAICAVLLVLAAAVPAFASKRSPRAIVESLTDREALTFAERPGLREELAFAERMRRENPDLPAFVVLGFGGWVLPYLQGDHGHWEPVPNLWGGSELDIAVVRDLYPQLKPGSEILLLLSQNNKLHISGESRVLGATSTGIKALRVKIPAGR